jgi:peptidoglycan/LPS O-acetylase OafA/YrhL
MYPLPQMIPQTPTGNTEPMAPANRAYYPALDGLRGAAFLAVFLHHYMDFLYGWAGVDVFFVLSGFLITGILYDTQDDPHRARNFYIRRTLRIFPLYYGVLLAIFLMTPLLHWNWTWQWIAWPLYLGNFLRFLYPHKPEVFVFYFANAQIVSPLNPGFVLFLGHFWTLCVEEQFYLVWPWIVFAVRDRRKLIAICIVSVIVVPFVRAFARSHLPPALVAGEVLIHATPFRFDTLMWGALIALLYRSSHRERMQRVAQWVVPIAVLCTVSVAIHRVRYHAYTYPASLSTWLLTLIAIFSGALLLRALVPGTIVYRLLNLRWLRTLGIISYGAYVFHDIAHNLLSNLANERVGLPVATMGFGLTIVLASVSYRYFELPILRLKDRLTRTA